MYCPQCGQQQSFEEMRFCSRCGFALGGVAELLTNNGALPPSAYIATAQSNEISSFRKGLRQGTLLIIIGTILTPMLGIISTYAHDHLSAPLAALSAIIFFLGGFLRILYARLFQSNSAPLGSETVFPPTLNAPLDVAQLNPRETALPSPTNAYVSPSKFTRGDTARMVSPSSVTENTTRLLNDERE